MLNYQFTNGKNGDFIALCKLLDDNLNEAVGGEKQRDVYNQYNTLEKIHDVVLAYDDGIAVGCAAFKFYEEGIAEVKRVFVKKEYRNQGIARQLMHYIEKNAKEQGFTKLILESGSTLKAAHSLYFSLSFQMIPNYGQYKDLPDSICMEKDIC